MELKQLRYFLTICEEKNISRAARKLFMSQPPLSQQLKSLEDELGVELFKRTTRSLEITQEGKLFQKRALQIIELSENTLREVKSHGRRVSGTLSVGFVASSGAALLPHRIPEFYRKYPGINFQVKEGSTHRILDLLDSGIIEIGIVRSPFNTERYDYIPLEREPMVAIGTREFIGDLPPGRILVENLRGLPLIIDRRFRKLISAACEEEDFSPVILCEGEDSRSLLLWASSGMGVAILPASIVGIIDSPDLSTREIISDLLRTKTLITWVRKRPLSPVAQKFIDTFNYQIPESPDSSLE